jgi:hypothetical protein
MRERTMHYTDNIACSIGRWSLVVRRWSCIAIATTTLVFLVGCGPEDGRGVGGGLGADLGNHAEDIPRSKLFVPGSQGAEDAQP